jgi:hypothetical protein
MGIGIDLAPTKEWTGQLTLGDAVLDVLLFLDAF